MEFRVEGEVAEDGMIHVATPDLQPGDKVTVRIEKIAAAEGRRVLGQLKGKVHILPGFDDPIEGLEWAYR